MRPLLLSFAREVRCPVWVSGDLEGALTAAWQASWRDAAIIADETVAALHGAELQGALGRRDLDRVALLSFPPGEQAKVRSTKARLEDELLAAGFGRQSVIIALGGGVSLDLAGFVAATYLRGVPHVNLPTSLVAQVDAAVGGKTGVNTPAGKNLVGAIQQPAAVIVHPRYLATLPATEWRNGLAELVKTALVADRALFESLETRAPELAHPAGLLDERTLRRCLSIKGRLVQRDETERGPRAVLNCGHTIGHALEQASGHALRHGEAVALGMLVEGRVAVARCGLPAAELERLGALLAALGLPTRRPPSLDFDQLAPFVARDKKNEAGAVRLALPRRIGTMCRERRAAGVRFTVAVPLAELARAWQETP